MSDDPTMAQRAAEFLRAAGFTVSPNSAVLPLLTREQVARFLRVCGYPYSLSILNRLSQPTIGEGPPVEKWQGRRPLHNPVDVLCWADARCRPASIAIEASVGRSPVEHRAAKNRS
jgi:hypothetical protein